MPTKTLQKERVSALLPAKLMHEVARTATEQSTTKSAIIEEALRLWIQHRLDQDTKALAELTFDDLPTEEEWDVIQSEVTTA